MNRWACLHDLLNYFKKSDLLGGLNELEKEQLRRNIGIIDYVGEGGATEPYETNYTNFQSMIVNNRLTTGLRYIIPFKSIYQSNVKNDRGYYQTWGDTTNPSEEYTLIITALTSNTIDPRVVVLEHLDWVVEYDPAPQVLPDGGMSMGHITYLRDEHNNEAYYDFKNIKFRRTQEEVPSIATPYADFYTFSDIVDGEVIDSSTLHNTKNNILKPTAYNNVFLGDTYNNIIETGCTNNTFVEGCHDSIIKWDSVNNVFGEAVRYLTGSIYNKTFLPGDTTLSTTISKTVHKVNDATIVSFLDPITYSYQVIII